MGSARRTNRDMHGTHVVVAAVSGLLLWLLAAYAGRQNEWAFSFHVYVPASLAVAFAYGWWRGSHLQELIGAFMSLQFAALVAWGSDRGDVAREDDGTFFILIFPMLAVAVASYVAAFVGRWLRAA